MRALVWFVGVAAAHALGTRLLGWQAVPLVGAITGGVLALATPAGARARPGLLNALAAAAGWGGLLGAAAQAGAPVGAFGERLGASMQLPGWAPVGLTVAFAALAGGGSAGVAWGVLSRIARGRTTEGRPGVGTAAGAGKEKGPRGA